MAALRLGRSLWRTRPQAAAAGSGRPAPLDFVAAAQKVGALERLERKPWVMLGDVREGLEVALGLATDELLIALAHWLESAVGEPAAVGLAHSSGNIYLGPSLDFGSRRLGPEQTLVANLYSHGEMGLDAVAAYVPPAREEAELLREVATYKRMRWLDANLVCVRPDGGLHGEVQQREPGSMIRAAKPRLLKKYPLVSEALAPADVAAAAMSGLEVEHGSCFQHASYKYLELEGSGMDEWQVSLARNSATRSYCPPVAADDGGPVGCAVLTGANSLYAGFSIRTRSGLGSLSPLQSALVSLGANGADAADILKVVWTGAETQATSELRQADEALLRTLAPQSVFTVVQPTSE